MNSDVGVVESESTLRFHVTVRLHIVDADGWANLTREHSDSVSEQERFPWPRNGCIDLDSLFLSLSLSLSLSDIDEYHSAGPWHGVLNNVNILCRNSTWKSAIA